jgi:hypothetical protein
MKAIAMNTDKERPSSEGGKGASPKAAAAFAAGTIYMWAEGIIRLWFSKGGDAQLRLWSQRAGDIGAMWLAMTVIGLVAYFALASAWRKRSAVGSIPMWTIVLIVSAIVAPLLGVWGQSIGI